MHLLSPKLMRSFTYFLFVLCFSPMSTANEVELFMKESHSGGLYINANIGTDVETEMLLDTGSSFITLSQFTFEKVNEKTELSFSRNIYGAMADGRVNQVPLYIIDELILAENCILKNVEVAILQNGDVDILGMNALKMLQPFTIQMMPAILNISNC